MQRSGDGEGRLAVDDRFEINPINILHHDVVQIAILTHIVDGNDVWVAQHRCSLRLVAKAFKKIGFAQKALLGDFDGNAPIQP